MTTPARRVDVLPVALGATAVAGVIVSVAMVVIGLPEQSPAQSVLLELAMVPISISLLAVLALLARRARPAGPRSRRVLVAAGVLGCAGVASMVTAYTSGPRPLVHFGQALVLVCLLAALLVELRLQPARRHAWFELRDESEE